MFFVFIDLLLKFCKHPIRIAETNIITNIFTIVHKDQKAVTYKHIRELKRDLVLFVLTFVKLLAGYILLEGID